MDVVHYGSNGVDLQSYFKNKKTKTRTRRGNGINSCLRTPMRRITGEQLGLGPPGGKFKLISPAVGYLDQAKANVKRSNEEADKLNGIKRGAVRQDKHKVKRHRTAKTKNTSASGKDKVNKRRAHKSKKKSMKHIKVNTTKRISNKPSHSDIFF